MIKVSILDDQYIVLNGVEQMLRDNPTIVLTGIYQNKQELLEGFSVERPDILLLDIRMPDEEGDLIAAQLLKKDPELKILALTNFDTIHYVKKMLRNGVLGYLLKNTDKQTLITAITTIYEGRQFLEPAIQSQLLQEFSVQKKEYPDIPTLTKREEEILVLIVKQHSSQEIADLLFLSLRTVENHRYNLFQKLNIKNMAGLVTRAFELGLLPT